MQYDKITHTQNTNINTNRSMHSEMGPVRQNPIQRTVITADLSRLITVHNFSTLLCVRHSIHTILGLCSIIECAIRTTGSTQFLSYFSPIPHLRCWLGKRHWPSTTPCAVQSTSAPVLNHTAHSSLHCEQNTHPEMERYFHGPSAVLNADVHSLLLATVQTPHRRL